MGYTQEACARAATSTTRSLGIAKNLMVSHLEILLWRLAIAPGTPSGQDLMVGGGCLRCNARNQPGADVASQKYKVIPGGACEKDASAELSATPKPARRISFAKYERIGSWIAARLAIQSASSCELKDDFCQSLEPGCDEKTRRICLTWSCAD